MIFHLFHAVLWAVALTALLASAWIDLKDRIIPNLMVGLVAASGLGLSLLLRLEQTWINLLAALLIILALGTLAHFGMMGGGDVKLIGATALLVPPEHIGQLLVFIALSGGLLSCAYVLAYRALRRVEAGKKAMSCEAAGGHDLPPRGWFSHECARIAAGGPMPYALAILGGVAGTVAGEFPQCLYADFCSF